MTTNPTPHLLAMETERRSQLLLNAVKDYAIYLLDTAGSVVSWNPGAERFKGYTADEIIGEHFSRFYTPEDRATGLPMRALETAAAEGKFESEGWRLRKDGTRFWANVVIDPVHDEDGTLIGFAKVTRDISDKKEAERALFRSEQQFRLLVQGVRDYAIYMLDPDGNVSSWNAGAQAIKGYTAEEIIGTHFSRFYIPADRDRGEPAKALHTALIHGTFEKEALRLRKDGTTFWAHVVIDPIYDDAGALTGFTKITRDVTERRRAQEELDTAREALAHSQKMEAIGRLTGGVAHDFNNLLTVVIGALDLILRSPEDAARRKKLGEAALSAARRGERLTHQLLAFSRRQALRPESIDLNALIREGEPLLRRAVGEAIEFRLKLRRGGARVSVDPAQFEAALLNLIVNARDALSDTGKVTVETMNCAVKADEVRELEAGDYVCVTVTDDGTGMDEATQGQVFEPFFTTKAVGKGTGLGLSQVYGFARQSGGGVRIRSAPGEGTTISIYLPPLAADQALAPTLTRRDGGDTSRDRRVLLVEDDPGVSAIAVELLEGLGYAVEAVESGPAALEALALGGFDAMLSDVVMPGGMSGIELAGLVGRHYPTLRVALTSGYAGDDVDAALADAPWPFLRKPYSRDQLRDTMEALTP